MTSMETDYISLGPVPYDENCAQVGEPDFKSRASKEMTAYMGQLYRMFPEAEEKNVAFIKKWWNHDFGQYGEVVALYFAEDLDGLNFVLEVESGIPMNWDDEAKKELGIS